MHVHAEIINVQLKWKQSACDYICQYNIRHFRNKAIVFYFLANLFPNLMARVCSMPAKEIKFQCMKDRAYQSDIFTL